MVISLAVTGLSFLLMVPANTLMAFALLMGLRGAFRPLFQVGADAMMADLVAPEQRADAYSLLRMIKNVGVALGPAIGGFIATNSYSSAFYIAAFCLITYSLIMALFARETLPERAESKNGKMNHLADMVKSCMINYLSTLPSLLPSHKCVPS